MSKTEFTGTGHFRRDMKLCRMCIHHDLCTLEVGECDLCDLPAECTTPEFQKEMRKFDTPLWFRLWLELRYPKTGWPWWFFRRRILKLFGYKDKRGY